MHVLAVAVALSTRVAVAETITVNRITDEPDADPNDGTADTDLAIAGLQVTLRSAVEHGNRTPELDAIGFAPELGSPRVFLGSGFPEAQGLSIDGRTSSGRVTIAGRGLSIQGDATVRGLAFDMAVEDALFVSGGVSLDDVSITNGKGWAVRAQGEVVLSKTTIFANARGGVLSASGHVRGDGIVVESNGGPGIVAALGIDLSSTAGEVRIRSNLGAGIYTDGGVSAGGGALAVSGNFGEGIRCLGGVSSAGALEILDNASWGIRSRLDVELGATSTVSGNGHGAMMMTPVAIALDLVLTTVVGDGVRGGGVLSAEGSVRGGSFAASDNAGPGVLAAAEVVLGRVVVLRNDGAGVQALGSITSDGGDVRQNLGAGFASAGDVAVVGPASIEDNSSVGVSGVLVRVGDARGLSRIVRNGRSERATVVILDGTLVPKFEEAAPRTQGVIAASFEGQRVDVLENGGDGVAATTVRLTDSAVLENAGAGVRAAGDVTLVRTLICDNQTGDLVAQGAIGLDESAVCDQTPPRPRDPGGCACAASETFSAPIPGLLLLALALLSRRR
jgi:MYXO-CTERM domain-containing protein